MRNASASYASIPGRGLAIEACATRPFSIRKMTFTDCVLAATAAGFSGSFSFADAVAGVPPDRTEGSASPDLVLDGADFRLEDSEAELSLL